MIINALYLIHCVLQVSDIHEAVDSLKGKVRALNPEPKVRP